MTARWGKKNSQAFHDDKDGIKLSPKTTFIKAYKSTQASTGDRKIMQDLVESRDLAVQASSTYNVEQIAYNFAG